MSYGEIIVGKCSELTSKDEVENYKKDIVVEKAEVIMKKKM